ncbi:hypothetical protein ABZX30_29830 [Streptomyces sp. NPDC004542]|uniref:hypothetical protein n=1 Tax=Streptomyces sp. NPDC004542 TaxID=3154281 RepID=UPI0033B4D5DE
MPAKRFAPMLLTSIVLATAVSMPAAAASQASDTSRPTTVTTPAGSRVTPQQPCRRNDSRCWYRAGFRVGRADGFTEARRSDCGYAARSNRGGLNAYWVRGYRDGFDFGWSQICG